MVSKYVVTQEDCESKRNVDDSVGLASYAMDSHFCQRVVVQEDGNPTVRNEGGFGHGCPRPYPVFEVKVPKPGDYQVNFLYVAHANRSTKTRVTVAIGDEKKEIVVNQRERDGNGKSLGNYQIETVITITVANRDTDGFVVVDGVQLLPR